MPTPHESYDAELFQDAQEAQAAETLWNSTKAGVRPDQPIGNFQVELTSAVLGPSQSSGRLQIAYEMVILVGEHKDKVIRKYDGLDKPETISITKQQLKRIGVDSDKVSLSQLPAVLLSLKGSKLAVQCKLNKTTQGEFYNIYFNKVIQDLRPQGKAATSGAGAGKAKAF